MLIKQNLVYRNHSIRDAGGYKVFQKRNWFKKIKLYIVLSNYPGLKSLRKTDNDNHTGSQSVLPTTALLRTKSTQHNVNWQPGIKKKSVKKAEEKITYDDLSTEDMDRS